jgi:hypothetical protein
MNWIVASIVSAFIGGISAFCVTALLRSVVGFPRLLIILPFLGFITGAVSLIGYWKVTSPDPARLEAEDNLNARKLVRISQTATYIASPIQTLLQYVAPLYLMPMMPFHSAISLTGNFAIFIYARKLAGRIPDDKLVRHCRIVMWGLSVLIVSTCVQVMTIPFATTAFATKASATSSPATAPAISLKKPSARFASRTVITSGTPTTMPAAVASPLATIAFIGLSIVDGLGGLIFGIWALRLLLRFRRALNDSALVARQTWAAQPPGPVVGPPGFEPYRGDRTDG